MQIIGVILIAVVIGLYFLWFWYTKNQEGAAAKSESGVQVFNILVKGVYSPNNLKVKMGQPVKINFRREESADCSRYVSFPDLKIRKELPEGQTVVIEFTPTKPGEIAFACDMGMYQGKVIVE
ncbi:MAG: hypothetical protein A3B89_01725 [Candidatus Buchananbacteria bacterium RIFCSPHIGHO2_02_FULL_40_13]|uniref:EfeO-type cupredoxin-like domain-containing protein n=1 Tax=Candidatus Buchananbacteria bacterium RIFCSPLOWO2_01_FULL_39_33 TaxID=1797543 RepID=A0A1G1YIV1_9BACT|nr:MAG: hypothetical protein A3B89_01725 [Candidatus Buchananbacteria bacterium RIFCSPHIGHO2_02_FULL_40_13]OGY52263.1 MAG: hypothetical protein A3A02_01675 [Candidatus Buchananbacteria bacterium RIFCSPLOWO2_01_FULL_39_33]